MIQALVGPASKNRTLSGTEVAPRSLLQFHFTGPFATSLAVSALWARPFPRVAARELNEERSEGKRERAEGAFKGETWEEAREDAGSLVT